jgi:hypothetical protein
MMTSLRLPHWLMIAGALLVVGSIIGLLASRRKADEDEADAARDERIETPIARMAPLPRLLDSGGKNSANPAKSPPA